MWENPMESAVMWHSTLETLPLLVLRVLAWLLTGFAIALACGTVGAITAAMETCDTHPSVC